MMLKALNFQKNVCQGSLKSYNFLSNVILQVTPSVNLFRIWMNRTTILQRSDASKQCSELNGPRIIQNNG